jgi:molecular chaperone DnaK (HSP70)
MNEPLDGFAEGVPSRYVVGIDLGTTNSAVSFIDTEHAGNAAAKSAPQAFLINQWTDIGQSE